MLEQKLGHSVINSMRGNHFRRFRCGCFVGPGVPSSPSPRRSRRYSERQVDPPDASGGCLHHLLFAESVLLLDLDATATTRSAVVRSLSRSTACRTTRHLPKEQMLCLQHEPLSAPWPWFTGACLVPPDSDCIQWATCSKQSFTPVSRPVWRGTANGSRSES